MSQLSPVRPVAKKSKPVAVNRSLEKHLLAYAVAAAAAGVGMTISAPAAEGKIVYTPANVVLNGNPLPIDLNHDGITDFFLFNTSFHTITGGGVMWACLHASGTGFHVQCSSTNATNASNAFKFVESMGNQWGAAMQAGAKIVGGDKFHSMHPIGFGQVTFTGTSSHKVAHWAGPWANGGKGVKDRYIGVRFLIKGHFHYGWARATFAIQGNNFTDTLTGYAYETIPGKGIIAGKTKGADVITLPVETHAGTLGHLALGRR